MSWFEQLVNKNSKTVRLCVEMSGNHQGSLDAAKRFVMETPQSSQICLKFQVYTPETITMNSDNPDFLLPTDNDWSEFRSFHELYQQAYTPWEWIEELATICDQRKLPWFASPFDHSAVEFLERIGCQAYKIASPEITDIGLIETVARTGKPVIVSTGLATWDDLDLAIDHIRQHHDRFAILKCTSAYPTPVDELNLLAIPAINKRYGCAVGISDHTVSDTASITAVVLGGTIIEKHFKLDGDEISIDNHFSQDLSSINALLASLNDASKSLGKPNLEITKSAIPSLNGRRSLYFDKELVAGSLIEEDSVRSVRPSFGMHPKHLPSIIGKRILVDVKKGDRVNGDFIEGFHDD